jgi:hypothetical protein
MGFLSCMFDPPAPTYVRCVRISSQATRQLAWVLVTPCSLHDHRRRQPHNRYRCNLRMHVWRLTTGRTTMSHMAAMATKRTTCLRLQRPFIQLRE